MNHMATMLTYELTDDSSKAIFLYPKKFSSTETLVLRPVI